MLVFSQTVYRVGPLQWSRVWLAAWNPGNAACHWIYLTHKEPTHILKMDLRLAVSCHFYLLNLLVNLRVKKEKGYYIFFASKWFIQSKYNHTEDKVKGFQGWKFLSWLERLLHIIGKYKEGIATCLSFSRSTIFVLCLWFMVVSRLYKIFAPKSHVIAGVKRLPMIFFLF